MWFHVTCMCIQVWHTCGSTWHTCGSTWHTCGSTCDTHVAPRVTHMWLYVTQLCVAPHDTHVDPRDTCAMCMAPRDTHVAPRDTHVAPCDTCGSTWHTCANCGWLHVKHGEKMFRDNFTTVTGLQHRHKLNLGLVLPLGNWSEEYFLSAVYEATTLLLYYTTETFLVVPADVCPAQIICQDENYVRWWLLTADSWQLAAAAMCETSGFIMYI